MIRRPLFFVTFSFAAAIAVSSCFGMKTAAVAAAAVIAAVAVLKKFGIRTGRAAVLMAAAYMSGVLIFCIYDTADDVMAPHVGKTVEIEGRVLQTDMKHGDDGSCRISIKLKVYEIGGKSAGKSQKVLVNYYVDGKNRKHADMVIPGDIISVSGTAEYPSGRRNPGCFDYRLYLESIGIKYMVKANDVVITDKQGAETLSGKMHIIKTSFLRRLEAAAGDKTAAMMGAVLMGEKEAMDEETLEEFQKNGTAHILAVSGLHVGIIYGFISWIWRLRKGKLYFAVVMMFFICYTAMAAFSPSVVRAVIMVGLHLLAKVTGKRYDMNSAAFAAALAMLVKNPMYLFNTGFQMSFLAVLTMALMISVIKRFYSGIFLSSLAVQIGLMPYTAYMFNYVSLASILVNVPIVFLTGIIVPAGLCSMAVMNISDMLFGISAELINGLCSMLISLNHVTAIDGTTVFSVVSPDIRILVIYYMSMAVFLSEEGRLIIIRRRKGLIIMLAAVVLSVAGIFGKINDCGFRDADVVFVDVGQGDCIHLRTEDGKNYLIDGGGTLNYNVGKKILKPYLLKNGVRKLDGIFVTHLHADHYKGVAELCSEGMADRLFLYEGNYLKEKEILKETGLGSDNLTYLYAGQSVMLSDGDRVDVLWPDRKRRKEYESALSDEADENLSSLVFKVTAGGADILVTGDIDEECQKKIEDKWGKNLKSDILKAPHHGSRYSYCSEFMESTEPQYGVFQVGKNNFGHPDKGVVENYRRQGIIVYRNDEDGAVAFRFSPGGEAEVSTVIKER